jgi:hypothetical protein
MKVSRQPRVSALFRIFAGTLALLWLVSITVFSIGWFCNCAGHEEACAAHASPVHEHAAVSRHEQAHSPDVEHHHDAKAHQHATASHHDDGEAPQGHCGKGGCEEQCRCSAAIQGFVQTPPVFVIPNPISQPVLNASLLCAGCEHVFAAPLSETLRRAKPRDWVFTPVVCLGPAFRSLAPPVLI